MNLHHRLAHTRIGQRMLTSILLRDPELAVEAIRPLLNRAPRFTTLRTPESVSGFEDLTFLFASGPLNHAVISMSFDEAALLYKLARNARCVVEIGRWKGGGTFLLAAAVPPGGKVYSYDLGVKLASEFDHDELGRELLDALRRSGLEDRVDIIVADSTNAELPPTPVDLVVVDGDHTYDGVRRDYEHWRPALAPRGLMAFHDSHDPDIDRLLREIEGELHFVSRVGNLTLMRA